MPGAQRANISHVVAAMILLKRNKIYFISCSLPLMSYFNILPFIKEYSFSPKSLKIMLPLPVDISGITNNKNQIILELELNSLLRSHRFSGNLSREMYSSSLLHYIRNKQHISYDTEKCKENTGYIYNFIIYFLIKEIS